MNKKIKKRLDDLEQELLEVTAQRIASCDFEEKNYLSSVEDSIASQIKGIKIVTDEILL
jgi:hypothetical protein